MELLALDEDETHPDRKSDARAPNKQGQIENFVANECIMDGNAFLSLAHPPAHTSHLSLRVRWRTTRLAFRQLAMHLAFGAHCGDPDA